jgi:hypothetical protein
MPRVMTALNYAVTRISLHWKHDFSNWYITIAQKE